MLSLPRLVRGLAFGWVLSAAIAGAQTERRPLAHTDFDTWRSIATPMLSRDGQWLAYSFMPQDADGDLVVRHVATGREHRVPVGAPPPPPLRPDDEPGTNPEAPPPPRNIRIAFTSDSRFAIATTHPAKADMAAARKARKKPEEMPKGGMVIVNLSTGALTRIADVKSFQVPWKGGPWLAYLKEGKPEEKKTGDAKPEEKTTVPAAENDDGESADDSDRDENEVDQRAPAARSGATGTAVSSSGSTERTYGTDLVLRYLPDGNELTLASVTDYSLARDGGVLLYTVSARTTEKNGVYAVTPGDTSAPVTLRAGRGRYSRLAWDREQTQAVFVSDQGSPTASRAAAKFKLYHWRRGDAEAKPLVSSETKNLPEGFGVSDKASSSFSRDGRKLYVNTAPAAKAPRTGSNAGPEEERVTADLWHWRDGYVQPMQKVRATQERNRSYRGVLELDSGTYTQLADPTMQTVTLSDDGQRAIGIDDLSYRYRADFDGRFTDVYIVDPRTGERKLALRQLRSESASTPAWSPDGKWACYYQNRQWHRLDTASGQTQPLTAKLRVAFHNEDHDRPDPASAYGASGWTKDSASFFVNDRYDVWQLFMDGRSPKNVTAGHGRANKIILRIQRIEPTDPDEDERGLDPAKPLVLRGEHEDSRATGFFRTTLAANGAPDRLMWGEKNHRYIGRAQDADVLLVTASRFDEYPDVHVTDSSFASLKKATEGGAQLQTFTWGTAELLRYRNTDGLTLKAALYKPAGFDPKKKYPLIVYIYERLAQNVNNFVNPAPGTSINVSFYTSNGYAVLMPDIVYRTGEPGQSALRCVLPAVDTVVRMGFIDEKAIGIQGHSWGGYQIAYMLTQTDRFRAAEAGAPVGNMTSAYSGIRWGSGLPRQFQYEAGQSRIGQRLQAAPQAYLANSPVFHVERVRTPLLILHNDADDAVPWYQGIELFLALRRHGKPSWLFNYNGEFHGLRRRADQKDWSRRMHQFFDHFLKGAAAPEWLERGIPYIEREEEKEKFNGSAVRVEAAADR